MQRDLWRTAFGRDPGAVGDGVCVTVIAVAGLAGYAMLVHFWLSCGWPY